MADEEKNASAPRSDEEMGATEATPQGAEKDTVSGVENDSSIKRNRTVAPVRKNAPTPKRRDAHTESEKKRTTPALFVRQSVGELKQVVWPSASTVRQYFWVVLVFVLFIMFLVAGLDWIFGWAMLKALG